RMRNELIEKELIESRRVHAARDAVEREEAFDLRCERETTALLEIEERLLPEAVASSEQAVLVAIPNDEGEHPAKPIDAPLALLLPEMDDDLAVAPRPKSMPARLEVGAKRAVVVDLAVADDGLRSVLARDRLTAAL